MKEHRGGNVGLSAAIDQAQEAPLRCYQSDHAGGYPGCLVVLSCEVLGLDAATPDNLPKDALQRWHQLPLTQEEFRLIDNNVAPYVVRWLSGSKSTPGLR
jgi:hypothetical protein